MCSQLLNYLRAHITRDMHQTLAKGNQGVRGGGGKREQGGRSSYRGTRARPAPYYEMLVKGHNALHMYMYSAFIYDIYHIEYCHVQYVYMYEMHTHVR